MSLQRQSVGTGRTSNSSSKYGDFHEQLGVRDVRKIGIFVYVYNLSVLRVVISIGWIVRISRLPRQNKVGYDLTADYLRGHLPSRPVVMNELMMVISNHDSALYAPRDLLKMDQTIYAQLFKIANTQRYRERRERKVVSIDDAIQVLSFEKVKQVAMNTTILYHYDK
ncbi:MAG TPA: hypothetical protein DCX67_00740 [Opitutae bacterium]|nr:hypothetical protein [Opitutae bacterium]